jgi:hypothetical protein
MKPKLNKTKWHEKILETKRKEKKKFFKPCNFIKTKTLIDMSQFIGNQCLKT